MSDGLSILITGSSSGFGRTTAEDLARKGHTVFATMRGVEGKNSGVAGELRQLADSEGLALHVLELDVTNDTSVDSAVQTALGQAGQIDVLVNNAGVGSFGMVEASSVEQAQALFEVNVMGVLRMNRAVLPHMRERGSGLVMYVSSGLGRFLFPFVGVYAASKFALEALAETAHYELSPLGVETAIVQPGAYGTTFASNMMPADDQARMGSYGPVTEMAQQFMASFEHREFGDPQEVTDAIIKIIEMPAGERPLRTPVGDDSVQAAGPINEAAAQVQAELMKMLSQG